LQDVVLHGERAVAPLKPPSSNQTVNGPPDGVLHGERAVAPLKHLRRGRRRPPYLRSPRRASRGPIQAGWCRFEVVAVRRSPRRASRGPIEAKPEGVLPQPHSVVNPQFSHRLAALPSILAIILSPYCAATA